MTTAQLELLDRVAAACIVFAQYADLDHTARDIDDKLVAVRLETPLPEARDWKEFLDINGEEGVIEVTDTLPAEADLSQACDDGCDEDDEQEYGVPI